MEYIIEIVLELLLEGSFELTSTLQTPKWLRCPLIGFILLFFLGVLGVIFITAYLALKENIIIGLLIFLVGILFIVAAIYKFQKLYNRRNPKSKASKEWNTFVERVCTKQLKELNETQKEAVIVFLYDYEMDKGGHKSVFKTHPIFKAKQEMVYNAIKKISNKKIADNYIAAIEKENYEEEDKKYEKFSPCLTEYLYEYIIKNEEEIFKNI